MTQFIADNLTLIALMLLGLVPLSLIVLVVVHALIMRKREAFLQLKCPSCGYSRTGRLGSSRCPECGGELPSLDRFVADHRN